jgi:hypothetical protein
MGILFYLKILKVKMKKKSVEQCNENSHFSIVMKYVFHITSYIDKNIDI